MPHHTYLIIGGGMTADAAVRGIRSVDEEGSIGIVGEEEDPPYDRPPLSKGLWKGMEERRIWRDTLELDVELHLGRRAVRIDREARTVTDDRGAIYSYHRLLLATGGTPRRLEDGAPQVNYFRTYRDYRRLRTEVEEGRRFAVVGGGFIGSEMAAALALAGKEVVVLFPEGGLCGRILPEGLSRRLNRMFEEKGVEVRAGAQVQSVRRSRNGLLVAADGAEGEALDVDGVVAGLGIVPNTRLAEHADLATDEGIVVDATFRTDDPRIYAAGDVAAFWSPAVGRTLRVEHEDHANSSGMYAGRAMAGESAEYDYLPSFYSDLFEVSYQAVGELDAEMETVEEWTRERQRGVVYYVEERWLRGVLLWNLPGKLEEARNLLRRREPLAPSELQGRIPLD